MLMGDAEPERRRGSYEVALRRKICGVNDECLAFPMATRISQPGSNLRRDVRATVHRNDARLVDHLRVNHNEVARLHDLVVAVVAGVQKADPGRAVRDTSLERVAILRPVGGVESPLLGRGRLSQLRLWSQPRKPAIPWLEDLRGPFLEYEISVRPKLIVVARAPRLMLLWGGEQSQKQRIPDRRIATAIEEPCRPLLQD